MGVKRAELNPTKHSGRDTTVLMHDPESMFQFEDNVVWVPVEVLEELDRFKAESSTRGANAREVHRRLSERFQSVEEMKRGVPLENGGQLPVCIRPGPEWNEQAPRVAGPRQGAAPHPQTRRALVQASS